MKIASFDVDAQKGFTPLCPDELPVAGGEQIAPALNELASRAHLRLGSKDAHSPHAAWIAPSHAQMLKPLPLDYDYFVWKGVEPDLHPYGACYHDLAEKRSTGAIEFLLHNGVQRVLVGGLALDYCVKTTALQLRRAGFEVGVYLPACRAIAEATAQNACSEMCAAGIELYASLDELDAALNTDKRI
ncbi:isochorismatase family protein [Pseudomonas anguilliseptica]|uniref:isochorismatase family protein n=1 Tax=Pseudomonas anguilliseptica TaxID=53406 RepID=UPI00325AA206